MIALPAPRLRRQRDGGRRASVPATEYAVRWLVHDGRMAEVTIDPKRAIDAYLRAGKRPDRGRDLVPPV